MSVINLVQKTVNDHPGLTTKQVAELVSRYRPARVDVVNRALERLSLKGEINRIKSPNKGIVNYPKPERFGITPTMAFFNKALMDVRNQFQGGK
ncbi:hypothetical protein [Yersinia alsatica]|uniref:hypothetical protein n=1 Tax=Yersinia alsatica TaxID=2890317 RepID=UPI0011A37CBF|nr:hypothetical protein [Yersinia alsatica]